MAFRNSVHIFAILACAFLAGAASAQEADFSDGKSVFERSRGDYNLPPKYLGSFKLKPALALSETSDSNIYATDAGMKQDLITRINPAIAVESDWGRHAINVNVSADNGFYADNSRENYTDYNAGISGRLDVLRETFLLGSVATSHLHEDRGSPDAVVGAKSPTEYQQNNASIAFIRNLRRISLKIDGGYTGYDYLNGTSAAGGVIENHGRNRNEYKLTGRAAYEIVPNYEAFIRGVSNKRDYVYAFDAAGINRDSAGYEVVAGTALNLGGKTKGEIFAGFVTQDYASDALKDISGAQFGGNILWNLTGLSSIRAAIARAVQETSAANASGYIATQYSLSLEHELRRNLLAGLNYSYETDDYKGSGAARADKVSGAGAELKYLMKRNISVIGKYNFSTRDSNLANQDYGRSVISLGLRIEM